MLPGLIKIWILLRNSNINHLQEICLCIHTINACVHCFITEAQKVTNKIDRKVVNLPHHFPDNGQNRVKLFEMFTNVSKIIPLNAVIQTLRNSSYGFHKIGWSSKVFSEKLQLSVVKEIVLLILWFWHQYSQRYRLQNFFRVFATCTN